MIALGTLVSIPSLVVAYVFAQWVGRRVASSEDEEIAEARWFNVDDLPRLPMSVSIARRLIDATATRLRAS